jgi:hypothetical protein
MPVSEELGIKMIMALRRLEEASVTFDEAETNWRKMTEREKNKTIHAYHFFFGCPGKKK